MKQNTSIWFFYNIFIFLNSVLGVLAALMLYFALASTLNFFAATAARGFG